MLQRLDNLPPGIVGIDAEGKVTAEDYDKVIYPLLRDARREGKRLRLLYRFGPEFEGFTAGAAWDDLQIGLQYMRTFERCAVVSSIDWITQASRMLGPMLPCAIKAFETDQWQDAIAWLQAGPQDSAMRHRLLPESGVVVVEPHGPLRVEDFDHLAITVDSWLEANGTLTGVVIHTKRFPGWENFGSFIRHIQFVRDHHRKIRRIALAADGKFAELGPKFADHFVEAEIKHFDYDEVEQAVSWASCQPA